MSTSTSRANNDRTSFRFVAMLAQVLSFLATWAFIHAVGVKGVEGFLLSLVVEAILIKGKDLLLGKAKKGAVFGYGAMAADTVLNGAGMFSYVDNLDKTEVWTAFTKGLQFTGTMDGVYVFIVAMGLGFLLAIAPHYLWQE